MCSPIFFFFFGPVFDGKVVIQHPVYDPLRMDVACVGLLNTLSMGLWSVTILNGIPKGTGETFCNQNHPLRLLARSGCTVFLCL